MKRTLLAIAALQLIVISDIIFAQSFFPDEASRSMLVQQVAKRQAILGAGYAELVTQLDHLRIQEEKDALLFLLANMTLADVLDQEPAYHIRSVREALLARESMPWGKQVPPDLFLHFVLPPRTGNEVLDSARSVMQRELFPRIQSMGMREAVLEINHWCHEYVTYQPSDARTSSPLASMRTGHGRCGEESVLTTAALRALGIPARQCYTPRWAHSDDNHAWVEAWVDGEWHFLGACEPAPDLDQAWFTGPARRAMLTATTVHGRYTDREEVIFAGPYSTRINTLPWYAPTRRIPVKITDAQGKPLQDCTVDFRVFNYAEFYPLAAVSTDSSGRCSFLTGYGDVLVWARHGENFAWAYCTAQSNDTVRLTPKSVHQVGHMEFEYLPPPPTQSPERTGGDDEICALRLRANDSIRGAYIRTFIDSVRVADVARTSGLAPDSTWDVLKRSAGNWREILAFLRTAKTEDFALAFPLLTAISEKDLRDANATTLLHHLRHAAPAREGARDCDEIYVRYVLNPRIRHEELRAWRGEAADALASVGASFGRISAATIERWIRDSIRLANAENWAGVAITPGGSMRGRITDAPSRNMLFVALCRTAGIPARIDAIRSVPQYLEKDTWRDVNFDAVATPVPASARLRLLPSDTATAEAPRYSLQYTLARFEDGRYKALDYENNEKVRTLPALLDVQPGEYMLVTGIRRSDGSVPGMVAFFRVPDDETTAVVIRFRDATHQFSSLGRIQPDLLPHPANDGCVLLWLQPGSEPNTHVVNSIAEIRDALAAASVPFLFTGTNGQLNTSVREIYASRLPAGNRFFSDENMHVLRPLLDAVGQHGRIDFPVVAFVAGNGNVHFFENGYSIGIGARLLSALSALRKKE
ncbi:MAG: transglutaminase domain-containing protein [Bacteroidia bacterium]|nr:transglutaminase domain-containing protein [Bacteroidia bacterium]